MACILVAALFNLLVAADVAAFKSAMSSAVNGSLLEKFLGGCYFSLTAVLARASLNANLNASPWALTSARILAPLIDLLLLIGSF